MTHVIVLNGGSSSGKTELAASLQAVLPDPWLVLGVDTLIDAMPASLREGGTGIGFPAGGAVTVGPAFTAIENAWMQGIATMARAGARVIVDDVFTSAAASQQRWTTALTGLDVLWVGVHCDPVVAAARECGRDERVAGMAVGQASAVHDGVDYDLEVDTTRMTAAECARLISAHLAKPCQSASANQ